jgi:hypothetical protein
VADADDENLDENLAGLAQSEGTASAQLEQKLIKMAEQLEQYRKDAQEFNKKKFKELIDENMVFHEWMEEHNRKPMSEYAANTDLSTEDQEELIKLGNEAGIPHPFACPSSPFFCNPTKETLLEIKNPTADHRPFQNLSLITLVNLSDKDKDQPQPSYGVTTS